MIQRIVCSIFVAMLFVCLVFTGESFAKKYAFGLVKNNDVIKIYDVDEEVFLTTIDLSTEVPGATGTITAMTTGIYERYLYFVTDNGADTAGKLFQVDLRGDVSLKIDKYTVSELDGVGKRPKAIVAGLNGQKIYVANYGSDSVSVYDIADAIAESADTETGFNKPVAITVTKGLSNNCDVFVANSGNNSVKMFNGIIEVDIALDNRPTDILTTLDYEYVYVCNSDPGATNGRISVIKPIDYLDAESDGDDIVDAGENTVIADIEIPDALPTKLKMIRGGDYIYAINPIFTEDVGNTDIVVTPFTTNIISVIDCSGRETEDVTEANTWSRNITVANGLVGITTTKDGTAVYTVGGVDGQVFVTTDGDEYTTAQSVLFTTNDVADSDIFQDVHLSATMPDYVTSLTVESDTEGLALLEWNNYDQTDTGVLIYRFDHNDDAKEYKEYLLEAVRTPNLQSYEDLTVINGRRYTYSVVVINDVSRSFKVSDATVKAKDSSDTEICFISEVTSDVKNSTIGLLIIGFAAVVLIAISRRKI